MLLLFVLALCTKCLLVEPQISTSSTANSASENVKSVTTTVVPTTAAFVATSSCDVNSTSCTTVSINNVTTITTATQSASAATTPAPQNASSMVATTTPSTAAAHYNLQILKNFDSDLCTCDLQRQSCDINCCCDKDCSLEDKIIFRTCMQELNLIRDTSFCQYMDYIYINNTPYAWEVNQNGLFCIAKSNLPPRYTLQKKKPIATLEDAELQKRNKYSWPETKVLPELKFNMTEDFVYGMNIWLMRNDTIEIFQLPNSFVTHICLIKQNMKFLHNFKTKCSQILNEDNPSLSARTYFDAISIIRAPQFFNKTFLKNNFTDCPRNICLPIEAKVCRNSYEQCYNFSNAPSRMHVSCSFSKAAKEHVCSNIVEKVKYNFYHNGTQGFTKIQLFIALKNLTYDRAKENAELAQEFEVNYFWSNYTLNYSSLLSGNPGYLIGKPILLANIIITHLNISTNSTNNTTDPMHIRAERNAFDITDNFLVFPASKKGECVLNNNTHIMSEFGYNMIAKCRIKAAFDLKNQHFSASDCCRILQKKIFKYWPVSSTNLTDINKLIGSFGNANVSALADWMRILSNKAPSEILNSTTGNFTHKNTTLLCNNLITTLKIDVFHSRVDFKQLSNQEKILGASFRFGVPKLFHYDYNKNKMLVFEADISEELMFFDVTTERIQKFVEPPTFSISLPYDFFYPFIKVGNAANFLYFSPLSMIICILNILL